MFLTIALILAWTKPQKVVVATGHVCYERRNNCIERDEHDCNLNFPLGILLVPKVQRTFYLQTILFLIDHGGGKIHSAQATKASSDEPPTGANITVQQSTGEV